MHSVIKPKTGSDIKRSHILILSLAVVVPRHIGRKQIHIEYVGGESRLRVLLLLRLNTLLDGFSGLGGSGNRGLFSEKNYFPSSPQQHVLRLLVSPLCAHFHSTGRVVQVSVLTQH